MTFFVTSILLPKEINFILWYKDNKSGRFNCCYYFSYFLFCVSGWFSCSYWLVWTFCHAWFLHISVNICWTFNKVTIFSRSCLSMIFVKKLFNYKIVGHCFSVILTVNVSRFVSFSIRRFLSSVPPQLRYQLKRWLEAWKYGAGLDHELWTILLNGKICDLFFKLLEIDNRSQESVIKMLIHWINDILQADKCNPFVYFLCIINFHVWKIMMSSINAVNIEKDTRHFSVISLHIFSVWK